LHCNTESCTVFLVSNRSEGKQDTMNENTTTTRVNVTMGGGRAVHVGSTVTVNGKTYAASPDCGGNRATESYRQTSLAVTCRKCLKLLAAEAQKEADYQDRLAASLAPATESHDLGYVHADEQAAADEQPEEIRAAREEAETAARGAAYAAQLLAGKADAAPVAYRPWGTDVLPPSVTMDPATRVLSGQVRDMRDLYLRGLADLNDAGDLVLC
jgi:hypothetical protein